MYIVAIGWMYVVLMMSLAENSVIAGIMTFLLYGVFPLAVIFYLTGTRRRRMRQQALEQAAHAAARAPESGQENVSTASEVSPDKSGKD